MEWCLAMLRSPCLWHGAEVGSHLAPEGVTVKMRLDTHRFLYARQVTDPARRELGIDLSRQVRELSRKLNEDDKSGILVDIPAKYQRLMRARGYDPVETWLETKLTDLLLNQGRTSMTDQLLQMIPDSEY